MDKYNDLWVPQHDKLLEQKDLFDGIYIASIDIINNDFVAWNTVWENIKILQLIL